MGVFYKLKKLPHGNYNLDGIQLVIHRLYRKFKIRLDEHFHHPRNLAFFEKVDERFGVQKTFGA